MQLEGQSPRESCALKGGTRPPDGLVDARHGKMDPQDRFLPD